MSDIYHIFILYVHYLNSLNQMSELEVAQKMNYVCRIKIITYLKE